MGAKLVISDVAAEAGKAALAAVRAGGGTAEFVPADLAGEEAIRDPVASARHSMGRFGEPREIGEGVKRLLCGSASVVNGASRSTAVTCLSVW